MMKSPTLALLTPRRNCKSQHNGAWVISLTTSDIVQFCRATKMAQSLFAVPFLNSTFICTQCNFYVIMYDMSWMKSDG